MQNPTHRSNAFYFHESKYRYKGGRQSLKASETAEASPTTQNQLTWRAKPLSERHQQQRAHDKPESGGIGWRPGS